LSILPRNDDCWRRLISAGRQAGPRQVRQASREGAGFFAGRSFPIAQSPEAFRQATARVAGFIVNLDWRRQMIKVGDQGLAIKGFENC
jgi:hypothetical protein